MQVFGLFIWTDISKPPALNFYIPGNSEVAVPRQGAINYNNRFTPSTKREVENSLTAPVRGPLRQMAIPVAWQKLMDYAFGPLITQSQIVTSKQIMPYTYVQNHVGTSEKHLVEAGIVRKGFARLAC